MQSGPATGESTDPVATDEVVHPAACENCAAPLHGAYCHQCGQSAHNPLRHVGHAIEEVFESFWHLDGRIFRTLRELFLPGRVARNYLAGHRVRYLPPLRLFVILSLLTFFVGRLLFDFQPAIQVDGELVGFQTDRTVAQVEQRRDRLLAKLGEAEREDASTPGANPALIATRMRIQSQAATRIAELRDPESEPTNAAAEAEQADAAAEAEAASAPTDAADRAQAPKATQATDATERVQGPKTTDGTEATETTASKNATPAAGTTGEQIQDAGDGNDTTAAEDDDSDVDCEELRAKADDRTWLPAFADRWINARVVKACENFRHADTEGGRLFQEFLAAVPSALFVLMPVFALLLKLVYLGSGRSYLEHFVVALYSHAFLLLMLMLMFLLSASESIGTPGWLRGLGYAAVWIYVPIYLLLMQKRVYGRGWISNLVRYCIIGCIYFVLVSLATVYAALIGISS
jgi:hypothetical protein